MAAHSYACQPDFTHNDAGDDSLPQPQWLERWREQGQKGFQFINSPALQRLLDTGVDVHDLTDVVHDTLEECEPAGRNGWSRSLELRQFGALPGELRAQIRNWLA